MKKLTMGFLMVCVFALAASAQTAPKKQPLQATVKVQTPKKASATTAVQKSETKSTTSKQKTAMVKPKHKHHKMHPKARAKKTK